MVKSALKFAFHVFKVKLFFFFIKEKVQSEALSSFHAIGSRFALLADVNACVQILIWFIWFIEYGGVLSSDQMPPLLKPKSALLLLYFTSFSLLNPTETLRMFAS